jgi:hypothetical protein
MPPNGLALSCAARIDQEGGRAASSLQKSNDLGAAQRRQLERRVGLRAGTAVLCDLNDGFSCARYAIVKHICCGAVVKIVSHFDLT